MKLRTKSPLEKKRRQKPRTHIISAFALVGDEIKKVLRESPQLKRPIKSSELNAIMVVAISPGALAASIANEKAREVARVFAGCYAKNPAITTKLLTAIQEKWNNQKSMPSKVRRILATQVFCKTVGDGKVKMVSTRQLSDLDLLPILFPGNKQSAKNLGAVTQARKRTHFSDLVPKRTQKLHAACLALEDMGIDTGMGRTH